MYISLYHYTPAECSVNSGDSSHAIPDDSVVIIHVKDIGQEGLGGGLLHVQLLHLALHHDCLPGQLLPGPGHPQQPGNPLEEQHPHPVRHLVSVSLPVIGQLLVKLCSDWLIPVMIVEDHDGGHHAARHHEHDAVEICS